MPVGKRSITGAASDPRSPEIAACRSTPGTTVFLEAGNTDGWIASDLTVDVPE